MKNIDYMFNIPSKGILSPDEEHFFYYDVMRDTGNNTQSIYEWNSEIEEFLNGKGIKVEVMEKGAIPQNVEKNVMFFSICQDESKPIAFFRHLRNAFAHHRIVHCCEYLNIEDVQGNNLAMKGFIKFQDLKQLCYLFFDQRTQFEVTNNL